MTGMLQHSEQIKYNDTKIDSLHVFSHTFINFIHNCDSDSVESFVLISRFDLSRIVMNNFGKELID